MKRIGVFFATLIVIYFSVWGYRLAHPKEYIIYHASSDDILETMTFYERVLSEDSFKKLLNDVITDNMDIRSILVITYYAKKNNLESVIQESVKSRYEVFKHFPFDTVWTVAIDKSYSRESSMKTLNTAESFFDILKYNGE